MSDMTDNTPSRQLELAILIAYGAHYGQTDKAGQSYIEHPKRVMKAVKTDEEKQVAILHDAIEDSPVTAALLRHYGFSDSVIAAVEALTRDEDENYFDFIARVKANPLATTVKIADLQDNMDLSRLPVVTERDLGRQAKYKKAFNILNSKPE